MASNFAFYPQATTRLFTVGASTITFSMTLDLATGTGTVSIASGIYQPSGVRVANTGTANFFIMFCPSTTSAPALTATNGIPILTTSVETFRVQGLPIVKMTAASEGTTTVYITCGEGL